MSVCCRVIFFYLSVGPCNELIKFSGQHLSLHRFTSPEKLKSRILAENGDPCRQPPAHWVRGGGNEAKVLIMEAGFSLKLDWALSPKQVKPACQHKL